MTSSEVITALYGRVSDRVKQGDNFSIPTQLSLMGEWVDKQGWTVGYELREKESAYLEGLSRSELNKVLELARQRKIHVLVFFSPDRFTRDIGDGVILRRELYRLGVKLICFYPTPREINSEMEIMHILNDYQSQQFIERMRAASMTAVRTKVDMGLYPQGSTPYGYRLEGKKHTTTIVIHEEERAIIVRIFTSYYYYNMGVIEIARMLNRENVPTRGGKLGEWTGRMVRKILNKRAYTGTWEAYTWRTIGKNKWEKRPKEERIPIQIPVIIHQPLFDSVQQKLKSRQAGRTQTNYLMSCRIACQCGRTCVGLRHRNGITPKIYLQYRCNATQERNPCGAPVFPAEQVDETLWQFALELISNPEKLLRGYKEMQDEDAQEHNDLRRQIAELTEQIEAGRSLLADILDQRDRAKSDELKAMLDERAEAAGAAIDELKQRLLALQAKLEAAPFTEVNIDAIVKEVAALREMYEALHTIDEEADFEAKRALIELLNLRCTLKSEGCGRKAKRWLEIQVVSLLHVDSMWGDDGE
jgi:site-specific DNA recombinase